MSAPLAVRLLGVSLVIRLVSVGPVEAVGGASVTGEASRVPAHAGHQTSEAGRSPIDSVAGIRAHEDEPTPITGVPATGPSDVGTQSWRQIGLPGFTASSVIVDPLRDRLLAYGGDDALGRKTGTVWARSLSRLEPWTQVVVEGPGPAPRMNHSTIYDPVRDRMIIYGGWPSGATGSREVWALELSGTPRWTDLTPSNLGPGYRIGAQMAYDPEGDRLIVVGGHPADNVAFPSDVWALDLSHQGEWVNLSAPEPWPPPREDGVMVCDPSRHRMILFGGCPGSYGIGAHADVWALSLGDSPTWERLEPKGEPMIGLHSFAAAFDPIRERLLIFSGRDSLWSDAPRPETWALQLGDSPAWSRVEATMPRPSPRYFSRAVYDVARDRMVLYGGTSDDCWMLTFEAGPAWNVVEPASGGAPSGLFGAAAAYDPNGHRTYLFGGMSGYYVHGSFFPFESGQLWSASLGEFPKWNSVARDSAPSPRYGHSALVDPAANRLLVYGGTGYRLKGDSAVWQLPLVGSSHWSRLASGAQSPESRSFHSAVYDSRRRRMIVYGGMTQYGPLGEVWAFPLDGSSGWARIETNGVQPVARSGHVAVYDSVGDRMVVFGGAIGSIPVDDTWELLLSGLPTWNPIPTSVRPPARAMPAAGYDPLRRRIVMVGGEGTGSAPLSDQWTFDLSGSSGWAPAASNGSSPSARWGAAAAFDEDHDQFLVLGGTRTTDPQTFDSNAWLMSSSTPVVTTLRVATVQAHPGRVAILWIPPGGTFPSSSVQRLAAFDDWVTIGSAVVRNDGSVRFEDLTPQPGARYAYRLRWSNANTVRISEPVWVDVPPLRFALFATSPNPSRGPITLGFSLPDAAPAQLELLDIAGRRLWHRQIGQLGAGDHEISIGEVANLRAGIYLIRLAHDGQSRVARICVVR